MNKINVFLADDHTIVRKGIKSILEQSPDIQVVGEAEDGKSAIDEIEKIMPDIAVIDISMPLLNGIEVTRIIGKRNPEIKIIILSQYSSDEYVFEVLKAGARAYVLKKAAPEELIAAIHAVFNGHSYLSPEISKKVTDQLIKSKGLMVPPTKTVKLTPREREVLQLIAEGHKNRQIADILFVSIKTIESHRTKIMEKLDLHNAAEITRYAISQGIIQP